MQAKGFPGMLIRKAFPALAGFFQPEAAFSLTKPEAFLVLRRNLCNVASDAAILFLSGRYNL
jgi:hypothetical protein